MQHFQGTVERQTPGWVWVSILCPASGAESHTPSAHHSQAEGGNAGITPPVMEPELRLLRLTPSSSSAAWTRISPQDGDWLLLFC